MPRKAPTEVKEHRITLGNYEREQLNEVVDDLTNAAYISSVGNMLQPFGELAGYGLIGLGIAYGMSKWSLGEIKEDLTSAVEKLNPLGNFGMSNPLGGGVPITYNQRLSYFLADLFAIAYGTEKGAYDR